jgi:catalase
MRGVHAKTHGILRGELHVSDLLPAVLAQGLFRQAGTHPLVMRFSTIPGDVLDDSVSTPRGLALKIIGVRGERLPGPPQDTTQDFVLVNAPTFASPNARKFLGNLQLVAATTDKAPGLKKALSAVMRGAERLVETFGGRSATLITLGG